MPTLPVDVIVDILCRLPVKTLLRFRCLSKQFRSIIDDPYFINRHLRFHSLEHRLIVEGPGACSKLFFLDLDSVDNAFKLELPFDIWGYVYFRVSVIGSCDGLLALSNHEPDCIALWNISTKKHQILPQCLSDFNDRFTITYGFGRDAATDDYKLVKIANCYRTNDTEVWVYSLKANCWRRIDGFPPCRYYFLEMAALIEGTLNWGAFVKVENRREGLIVSFDLKNEVFFEVSLPDTIGELEDCQLSVMGLGECLCLVYSYQLGPVYDIWVMKEYGLRDSWTKLYTFFHMDLPWRLCPSAFVYSKHRDKIFIFQVCGEVLKYDLEQEKFENFKIKKLPKGIKTANIYVESLVSPHVNN